jgi:hypothetical protein
MNPKRNPQGAFSRLAITMLVVMLIAGCMPIPIPIPSGLVLPPGEMLPSAPAEEAAPEVDESAALVEVADGPSPLTHGLQGREECIDCHAVDDNRSPAPADHAGYSDAVCLFCHMPEEGRAAIPPLPEKAETGFCLTCHGSFEDLMMITAGMIVDELGIEGNPHMYVPHDGNQMLSCDSCHTVHALPVPLGEEIPEANIQYCYAACHHERTFEACDACH